jgi:hypothetical protein
VVKATLEAEDILSEELRGQARAATLEDFFVGADWLRGTDVDQLSSREAGVIASRLVKRLQTKAAISEEVVRLLHSLKSVSSATEFSRSRWTTPAKN